MKACVLHNICSDCGDLISESDLDDSDSDDEDEDGEGLKCRETGSEIGEAIKICVWHNL